jgi:O-antigen/teichoic acid export membrane protein
MSGQPARRSPAVLGVHTLATRLVIHTSGFVASVLVAHGLGPSGVGRYTVAMTVGTIATLLASLGFEQAQAKAWSSGAASRQALFGTAIGVAATTGFVAAGVVLAGWYAERAGVFQGVGPLAITIVAALIPVRVLLALSRGLLIVGGETVRSNVALAVGDVARTLTIAALTLLGAISLETVLAAFWLTMLVPLLPHARAAGPPGRPSARGMRRHLRAGAALSPYFLFLYMNLRLDVLLLAKLTDARAVGLYAVAVAFAELVWLVTDAITTGARERQWGMSADDSRATTAAAARMSLLMALLAAPVLAMAAPAAIRVLFGDAFAGATAALWGLLPAAAAMAWWRALSPALVRFGRPSTVNGVAFAALALNAALNLLLIPDHGISGPALASLGSYAAGATLAMLALRPHGIAPRQLVPGREDVMRLARLVADGLTRTGARLHRG